MSKLRILGAFLSFMRKRKAFWLYPVILALLIVGILVVLGEGSALAPFIYSIF